eukprot:1137030-Pelagomonas_calceolata.AAC.2
MTALLQYYTRMLELLKRQGPQGQAVTRDAGQAATRDAANIPDIVCMKSGHRGDGVPCTSTACVFMCVCVGGGGYRGQFALRQTLMIQELCICQVMQTPKKNKSNTSSEVPAFWALRHHVMMNLASPRGSAWIMKFLKIITCFDALCGHIKVISTESERMALSEA